ncbi:hypothetical protein Tco_0067460 [Tanacetum coccineum]
MIASSSSRNSSKNMPRFSSNDMVHNHYLEEAKKKTQEIDRNSKTSVMPSARFQSTADDRKPKPWSTNHSTRSLPVSKSSCITIADVPIADHSKNFNYFSDSKHFVKSHKTRNSNKPVEQKSHTQKPSRQIFTGYRFSPNKSSAVYEKTSPRSCLRLKPTGRIFDTVGLRWIPTGNLLDSCMGKVDSEPPHGSNADISKIHECKQTMDLSAGTSLNVQKKQSIDLSAGTSYNVKKENLRLWLLKIMISQKPFKPRSTMSTEVPTLNMIVMTSMPELESLFNSLFDEYFNVENLVVSKSSAVTTAYASDKRQQQPDSTSSTSTLATTITADGKFDVSYALSWKPCQGDSLNLPDHRYKCRCCSPIPAKSDSLPHTHTQAFKVNHSASRLLTLNFLKDLQSQIKNRILGRCIDHNFLRLKEGFVYLVKNFTIVPNKDEIRVIIFDDFMFEFDGETTVRKAFLKSDGFTHYPFQLVEIDELEPTNNKYLIDVVVYVTNVGRITQTRTDRLYLSSTSSTLRFDDEKIPLLMRLKTDDSGVALTKEILPADNTTPKAINFFSQSATFLCEVTIDKVRTKKGWNYPWCDSCNSSIDYPIIRYRLELEISDETAEDRSLKMSQPANDEFSQHLSDDEASNHDDASDTGAAPKQQQQVIPQTTAISNIKLPILKKEEISTGKDGVIRILPPVTAAEIQTVEKERKAKNILLMVIPKEHMRRFHAMDDAKEIWKAIRTRFGGNANSDTKPLPIPFQTQSQTTNESRTELSP